MTVLALPSNVTVAPDTKLDPLMVTVRPGEPAGAESGESEVIAGGGGVTVKFTELELPPPGDGLVTTTAYVPALARSLAVRSIVSSVELTKVTGCPTPL